MFVAVLGVDRLLFKQWFGNTATNIILAIPIYYLNSNLSTSNTATNIDRIMFVTVLGVDRLLFK
jgi:hypothetical protein